MTQQPTRSIIGPHCGDVTDEAISIPVLPRYTCGACDRPFDWPDQTTAPDWLRQGREMRLARVARMESLRDAARRLGVEPRLLGDIEHGRADPARLAANLFGRVEA